MMTEFKLDDLSQRQNEALLGLLITMYRSDSKIKLQEQDLFEQIKRRLNWQSGVSVDNYCAQITAQVRDDITQKMTDDFIAELSDFEGLVQLAKSMAESDAEISVEENQLLQFISKAL